MPADPMEVEKEAGRKRPPPPVSAANVAAAAAYANRGCGGGRAGGQSSASAQDSGPEFSPELLRIYYSRLFPYEAMYRWLSYGGQSAAPGEGASTDESGMMVRREFSFTIEDDIYIRYQCFRDLEEMRTVVQRRQPHKIDIGAIFTLPPRDHAAAQPGAFFPVERELVFDVDLTDYDDVRTCCSGAKICRRCWGYMAMAMHVMDRGLREDFGFKNLLWVYSGRRGVHCWVSDPEARALTNEQRSAVADYFSVVSAGENQGKKVKLSHPIYPAVRRAYGELEPLFRRHIAPASGQGLLATPARWRPLLDSLPFEGMADEVDAEWRADVDELDEEGRWDALVERLGQKSGGGGSGGGSGGNGRPRPKKQAKTAASPGAGELWCYETVLTHCYPRLDVNVSKAQNHLLKSPFVAHPKTGRICVPIDPRRIDDFDPFAVPTLGRLARQIDEYDHAHPAAAAAAAGGVAAVAAGAAAGRAAAGTAGEGAGAGKGDLHKTELQRYVEMFEADFLQPLYQGIRRRRRDDNERMAAVTTDF
ncbi:unnamed protein product [Phaeothamnion confervicola]